MDKDKQPTMLMRSLCELTCDELFVIVYFTFLVLSYYFRSFIMGTRPARIRANISIKHIPRALINTEPQSRSEMTLKPRKQINNDINDTGAFATTNLISKYTPCMHGQAGTNKPDNAVQNVSGGNLVLTDELDYGVTLKCINFTSTCNVNHTDRNLLSLNTIE